MNKIGRFLLIIVNILMLFSMTGCDTLKDETENIIEEIDISNESIAEIDTSINESWKNDLSDIKVLNEYNIDIEFDPAQNKYVGKQLVKYVNNEDVSLNEIYFHIYPNAFREDSTTPYSLDSYIGGFNTGSIDFIRVMVEDKESEYSILGDDSTLLKIPMKFALDPGEVAQIYLEYEVVLPKAAERFGYGDNTFQIGNGYPIAAVYDSKGWNMDLYYPIGDPFYSDVSNYSVQIKAPKEYIIACSGKILSEKIQGENKVWDIEAKLMRDFAWAASQNFVIQEKVVDGILVKNYLLPNDEAVNSDAAGLAYRAFEVYNRIFGKYPYEVLSIATVDATGMEYPGMVFVWKNTSVGNKSFESTLTHEIAHQWWYGVVGNNQIEEAWLDESFAIYSEKLFYDETQGKIQGEKRYDGIVTNYESRLKDSNKNELILTPTYKIEEWNEYSGLMLRGAMFLYEIEKDLGKDQFYNILNNYYDKHRFSIATTKDFMEICEELSGKKYGEYTDKWFLGNE